VFGFSRSWGIKYPTVREWAVISAVSLSIIALMVFVKPVMATFQSTVGRTINISVSDSSLNTRIGEYRYQVESGTKTEIAVTPFGDRQFQNDGAASEIITVLVRYGVIGFVIYVTGFALFTWQVFRSRSMRPLSIPIIAVGLVGLLGAKIMFDPVVMPILAVIAGLAIQFPNTATDHTES